MKKPGSWFLYAVVRVGLAVLGWLPRAPARLIARSFAAAVWQLDNRHRRVGMTNLGIAFPDRSAAWRRLILRESFLQLGDHAVEISRLARIGADELCRRVRYESERGLPHYLEARRAGKGVLFVTAHLGAWELLPAAHAARGYPLSFLVRRLDNSRLDDWSRTIRCRFGNSVVDKRGGLRRALRLLKAGKDVGFLLDQNVQESEGVYAPLFGHPASTSSSVAVLAVRTGAPIVLGFLCPEARVGHHRIRFYAPLYARPGNHPDREVVRLTERINQRLEEVIREFPEYWLWGHRRFQTQPDGRSPYS